MYLYFPGIFRGALDVRAKEINEEMKLAAAYAIANYIKDEDLNENNVIPSALDKGCSYKSSRSNCKSCKRNRSSKNIKNK